LHFYLTRRVLRKAARVIAVSQFTKNEIEKLLAHSRRAHRSGVQRD
jgi:hypothetical protein